jgi:predicted transcriptional regulator
MVKTTVYLDDADYRRLKRLARDAGRKPAELVRESVAEYTRRHTSRQAPKSLGAFASRRGNVAARDETLLRGLGQDS